MLTYKRHIDITFSANENRDTMMHFSVKGTQIKIFEQPSSFIDKVTLIFLSLGISKEIYI